MIYLKQLVKNCTLTFKVANLMNNNPNTPQKRLFVAGLPYALTDQNLKELFMEFGTVVSSAIIKDKLTQRSRGFGFVEMSSIEEAETAIDKKNNSQIDGRTVIVTFANPPAESNQRSGFRDSKRGRPDFSKRRNSKRW